MSSVTYATGRLPTLSASEVEALAAQLPLRPLPRLRRRLGSPPPRRSRRTAAHRAAERAPVVSRRMRRIHNEALLALSAAQHDALPVTRADLKRLFETSSRSAWREMAEQPEQASLWRGFVELDEGEQGRVLQEREGGKRDGRGVEKALARVDRKFRELIKTRKRLVKPIVGQLEETVVGMPPGGQVVVRMPDALGRLVAHGVAQFHELGHRSVGRGEERVTVIQKAKERTLCGPRLMDVLA